VLWSEKRSTFGVLDALAVNPQTAARLRAYLYAAEHMADIDRPLDVQKPARHRDPGTTKLYDRRGYNPQKAAPFDLNRSLGGKRSAPSTEIQILTGSMCIATKSRDETATVKLSNSIRFNFRISGDGDIILLFCLIKDLSAQRMVVASENYFKFKNDEILEVE